MKTSLTILAGLMISNCRAQLTLITLFNTTTNIVYINLQYKYEYTTSGSDSIVILNYDLSIYKTISVVKPANIVWQSYVADIILQNFFTTDGLISYSTVGVDTGGVGHGYVYKEDGTQLLAVDSIYELYPGQVPSSSGTGWGLWVNYQNGTVGLYSVPGSYCDASGNACGSSSGIIAPNTTGSGSLEMFPNPSNNQVTINYKLPQGANTGQISIYALDGKLIKKIPVSGPVGVLSDNVTEPGPYFYQLSTSDGAIIKKQIYTR